MPSDEQKAIANIELSWRHFYTNSVFDKTYLLNHKMNAVLPSYMMNAVLQLTTMVAGERIADIKYPLNWVQAFRERWFPQFILKRWPVKYHTWKVDFLYPEIELRKGMTPRIAIYDSQRSKGYPSWEDKSPEVS